MMNFILLDTKESWQSLLPFTFTRPIGEIRFGIFTIKDRWEKLLSNKTSYLTQQYLAEKYPAEYSENNLLINSTIIPSQSLINSISDLNPGQVLVKNNFFIAEFAGKLGKENIFTSDIEKSNRVEFKGELERIKSNWDIFSLNPKMIESDYHLITSNRKSQPISSTNKIIGDREIFIENGAKLEHVILNATDGPIYIGKDSEIMEGSIIRGPFAIGDNSVIKMGARIYPGTTVGPFCKVGGEINNSVFFGYSNKAHEGFLGNSVIGEWCNIGADSNNSNLKNNYENVKVWNYIEEKFVNTGLQFCGLFMGDHTKCGINTMFNTGTTIGISANIFGSGFPRTFIPSFSWGGASGMINYRIEKAIESAKLVMKRRNINFSEADKNILIKVFDLTQKYRTYEK